MPSHWLLKTEPGTYSYDQLERDGKTAWDGVRNSVALMHLRAMKPGDQLLIYHTGAVKAVVGLARVAGKPYPDPKEHDPRLVVVEVVPAGRLKAPVPLATIKADPGFADLPLVRMPRLSVMPVSAEQWNRIVALGQ
jgi:predicted RNA-binding protein with PUA-like domain